MTERTIYLYFLRKIIISLALCYNVLQRDLDCLYIWDSMPVHHIDGILLIPDESNKASGTWHRDIDEGNTFFFFISISKDNQKQGYLLQQAQVILKEHVSLNDHLCIFWES